MELARIIDLRPILEVQGLPGVNDKLRDQLLKHNHLVSRFENGTMNEMMQHYATAKLTIMDKLARVDQYGTGYTLDYRVARLTEQLDSVNVILQNAARGSITDLSYNLSEFAKVEKTFVENLIGRPFGTIGIDISRIPFEQVERMVTTPLGGATFEQRMIQHYGTNIFTMRNELTQSMILGEDMARASRRLFGTGQALGGTLGGTIQKQSSAIARTEIQRVSNEVSVGVYKANQDIIKGLQFVSTLDNKTCLVCGNLDSRIFYFDKNPVTGNEQPPIHVLCRCTLVPVTKSWKELGMKSPGKASPGTRASFNGQVSSTLNYAQWLKKMNIEDQPFVKNILGPTRYDLWSRGRIEFVEMVRDNRILTLKQLDEIVKAKPKGVGVAAKTKAILKNPRTREDFLNLPVYTPTKEMQKVQAKYTAIADWRQSLGTSKYLDKSRIIAISDRVTGDFVVELHEYGHFVQMQGGVDRESVNRLFQFYKKTALRKNFGDKQIWFVIDDNIVWGKDAEEMFADLFKYYHLGKLKGPNKEAMKMLVSTIRERAIKYGYNKGLQAQLTTNAEWSLTRKIDGSTLDGFLASVRGKQWDDVAKLIDDALANNPLADVQHNLNDMNMLRYMFGKGMNVDQIKPLMDDYIKIARAKLYKSGVPSQSLPQEVIAKMTKRQIAAHQNKWTMTKQSRNVAEHWEKEIARKIGAEHIVGSRPFDLFVDNEFIEWKTILKNTKGLNKQLSVSKNAKANKANFVKKYGVRPHQAAIDTDPNSEFFGKLFYRNKIGEWELKNMTMVGDIDDPETMTKFYNLLKKGARKFDEPPKIKATIVPTKTLDQSQNWMKKQLGITEVDYDDLDNRVAQQFNAYMKGAIDELGVKPSAIRFDESFFVGKNSRVVGMSFEDGTIVFNPNVMRTIDDLEKLAFNNRITGQLLTGSKGHIFRHELAHQRYFQLGGTEATSARKLSKKVMDELSDNIEALTGKGAQWRFLSKYALTNEGEFYAEQLARQLNGEVLHPVVKKIMRDIERRISKDGASAVVKKTVKVR